MRRVIEEMFTRQQQMENELASTRAALNSAESGRRVEKSRPEVQEEVPISALLRALVETLLATSRANSVGNVSGLRD